MTKSEAKDKTAPLIHLFLKSDKVDELITLKQRIISEVSACGYNASNFEIVKLGILTWGNDLDKYIAAIDKKILTPELKKFTKLSLVGLINFVEISNLPE